MIVVTGVSGNWAQRLFYLFKLVVLEFYGILPTRRDSEDQEKRKKKERLHRQNR
jgi:hypothetical protein